MKPILFNTEMVRAILDNRKTVTRRVVKPQPKGHAALLRTDFGEDAVYTFEDGTVTSPPYRHGDILYVRETWCQPAANTYWYKADSAVQNILWRSSIHMPKEAARIFLRVTEMRVERLQDMPHDGPLKEGIRWRECPDGFTWKDDSEISCCYTTPMGAMRALWDSTIKPADRALYGWEANPWVWVIEFERCEKPKEVQNEID